MLLNSIGKNTPSKSKVNTNFILKKTLCLLLKIIPIKLRSVLDTFDLWTVITMGLVLDGDSEIGAHM